MSLFRNFSLFNTQFKTLIPTVINKSHEHDPPYPLNLLSLRAQPALDFRPTSGRQGNTIQMAFFWWADGGQLLDVTGWSIHQYCSLLANDGPVLLVFMEPYNIHQQQLIPYHKVSSLPTNQWLEALLQQRVVISMSIFPLYINSFHL